MISTLTPDQIKKLIKHLSKSSTPVSTEELVTVLKS
jgi:hypothetical protein